MRYPQHLLKLIHQLKKLPGVGGKSAERFAFQLLEWPETQLTDMADVIRDIPHKLRSCDECGCLIGEEECYFCHESRKAAKTLCVISSSKDAYAIEQTREYCGLYHVLGGLLSPLKGIDPDKLRFNPLLQRIKTLEIEELVIALDATLEGDATALYLKKALEPYPLSVSRLAFGIPMGSSFEYVDGGTLARALIGRSRF